MTKLIHKMSLLFLMKNSKKNLILSKIDDNAKNFNSQ